MFFVVVYSGCDYITGIRTTRWRIDLAFEQSVPFIPQWTVIYSSMYLMFAAAPFILSTRESIQKLKRRLIAVTLVAGIGFLLFPAELRFPPQQSSEQSLLFRIADSFNLTYNLCPSLHVAFSALCAESFRGANQRAWPFHLWGLAIATAAWLTHQHHLIDLLSGYALGFLFPRLPYSRKT